MTEPDQPPSDSTDPWAEILSSGSAFEECAQYAEAIQAYRRYLAQQQNNPWAYAHLAECLRQMGETTEALEMFAQAVRLDPHYTWAYVSRGLLYLSTGAYALGLLDFQKALSHTPEDTWLLNQIGECLCLLNQQEEALAFFNQSVGLDPDSAWSLAHRGRALLETGRHEEALLDFHQALRVDPQYGWAYFYNGVTLGLLHRDEEALESFAKTIELTPDFHWAFKERGILYLSQTTYGKALADFDHLLTVWPHEGWLHALRAQALAGLGRRKEALDGYTAAIQYGAQKEDCHFEMGILHLEMGALDLAAKALTRTLKLNPAHVEARSNRANVHLQLGKPKQALKDINRAIELAESPYAWHFAMRGEVYGRLEQYEQAQADFDCALELNPQDTWALSHRGYWLCRQDRYAEAGAAYQAALMLDPANCWTLYQWGKLNQQQRQYPQAIEQFLAVLQVDSGYEAAAEAIVAVCSQMGQPEYAAEVLQQFVARHMDDSAAWERMGFVYHSLARWQEAMDGFSRALELNPYSASAFRGRALARKNCFQMAGALEDIQRCLALNPVDADAHVFCAQIYRNLRQYAAAVCAYDRALELGAGRGWAIANRGYARFLMRDWDRALADYLQALKSGYQNSWIRGRLGEVYLALGDTAESLRWYRLAAEDETDDWASFACGLLQARQGNSEAFREQAACAVRRALQQKGGPGWTLRTQSQLAVYYLALGDVTASLEVFCDFLAQNPPSFLIAEALHEGGLDVVAEFFPALLGLAEARALLQATG